MVLLAWALGATLGIPPRSQHAGRRGRDGRAVGDAHRRQTGRISVRVLSDSVRSQREPRTVRLLAGARKPARWRLSRLHRPPRPSIDRLTLCSHSAALSGGKRNGVRGERALNAAAPRSARTRGEMVRAASCEREPCESRISSVCGWPELAKPSERVMDTTGCARMFGPTTEKSSTRGAQVLGLPKGGMWPGSL